MGFHYCGGRAEEGELHGSSHGGIDGVTISVAGCFANDGRSPWWIVSVSRLHRWIFCYCHWL